MMKKKYTTPQTVVVPLEGEELLNVVSSPMGGSTDVFGANERLIRYYDDDYDDYEDEYVDY